jgi:type II secretory pathway pseudopilin PulG
MMHSRTRSGSTLIEMTLFLGIVGIMSSAMVGVFISLQEARVRQQHMSEVELRGMQLLGTMTRSIRGAEIIMSPTIGNPSDSLALQMTQSNVNPTVFMPMDGGNILLIEKTATASLLGPRVTISGLQFRNIADTSVTVSFDMNVLLPTVPQRTYSKHFTGTATLTPKKRINGGCAPCPLPTCTNGEYEWNYCDNGVCTVSPNHVGC